MNPKNVTVKTMRLRLPMIQFGDTPESCVTTERALAGALGISDATLGRATRRIYANALADKMSANSISDYPEAMSFFQTNREAFGLPYVRGNMHLYTLKMCLLVALHSNSKVAGEFQLDMVDMAMNQAVINTVPYEQHQELVQKNLATEERLSKAEQRAAQVEERLSTVEGALGLANSSAGKTLRMQRTIKEMN